jgi:gamma-glutamyltranspeptidase
VVLAHDRPVMALGGRGGRRIPNAVASVLLHYVGEGAAMSDAVAARRLHTEGGATVVLEGQWPEATIQYLATLGYATSRGKIARVDAASFEPGTRATSTASH